MESEKPRACSWGAPEAAGAEPWTARSKVLWRTPRYKPAPLCGPRALRMAAVRDEQEAPAPRGRGALPSPQESGDHSSPPLPPLSLWGEKAASCALGFSRTGRRRRGPVVFLSRAAGVLGVQP